MSYFESRLGINIENTEDIRKKLDMCKQLGIKNLIIEAQNRIFEYPKQFKDTIKELSDINIKYRLHFKPKTLNEFRNGIKKYSKYTDVLSIETSNKEVQLQAAKDSRIDVISFSDENTIKTLTRGVLSLIKQNNSFIEFSLAPLMVSNKAKQSKNFRNFYRFIHLAIKSRVNFIISGNFQHPFDLRNPRSLMSICYTLLDVSLIDAKKAFSDFPMLLLERIENRKNQDVFEPGVKLIRGEDKK